MVTTEEMQQAAKDQPLGVILDLLRKRHGYDFSSYKTSAVVGRIERRMAMLGLASITAYERLLASDSHELAALADALLIGVTAFFRDAPAFDSFAVAMHSRVAIRNGEPLRIWVPGCSTGEEPYSIAMVLQEYFSNTEFRVFATDVDRTAIERARSGLYSDLEPAVRPSRVARHFHALGGFYEVARSIRSRVVFATKDLFADRPPAKLDAISCRNLLIYLDPEQQEWVLRLFHYALEPGGLLFLGSAESIGNREDLFEVVDSRWRIYRRTGARAAEVSVPYRPAAPAVGDEHLLRLLVDTTVPPSVVIDEAHAIIHAHGAAARFIDMSATILAPKGRLAEVLADALARAALSESVNVPGVLIDDATMVDLRVHRVSDAQRRLFVIAFERARDVHSASDPTVVGLKRDLQQARDDHRRVVDRLYASTDQLQAMGETLMMTNEELETAKEELLAIAAERDLVNAELVAQRDACDEVTDDLRNVLQYFAAGLVILDRDLRIVRVSEAARSCARYCGSLLADVVPAHVVRAVTSVLHTLEPCTIELPGVADRVRAVPYRSVDRAIDGVALVLERTKEQEPWQ